MCDTTYSTGQGRIKYRFKGVLTAEVPGTVEEDSIRPRSCALLVQGTTREQRKLFDWSAGADNGDFLIVICEYVLIS